ncbi:MAG: CvfD/Ygs/GSP13 family RNA-binding post-transcriptional regulator [Cellulosilyticaceae bacterium]
MSEKFQVGQIIEGTVTGVKSFGAFVALDANTQGLVHISHITHGFLENIEDAVKVGDTVKVKILSIDGESGKISLSIKNAKPAPPRPQKKQAPVEDFESLMKGFLKDSNDRQVDINKRLNR